MNFQILQQISFAFLPILVFILADELYGLTVGMAVAIVFSLGEFIYIRIRYQRNDAFVLFDVVLISLLGGISWISANDLFFKLKPAFIESILLGIFGINAFSSYPLMEQMAKRYLKEVKFNDYQKKQMRIMSQRVFFIVLLHTLLVIYTAIWSSRRVWAFTSGGLFYVIFFIFLTWQWWSNKKQLKNSPTVDIFNMEETKVGEIPEFLLDTHPGYLHKAAHLHILNDRGELLLTRCEGNLDIPLTTHVYSSETVSEAVTRKLAQPTEPPPGLLFKYYSDNPQNFELVYAFLSRDPNLHKNPSFKEPRFYSFEEIRKISAMDSFTPCLLREITILEKIRNEEIAATKKGSEEKKQGSTPKKTKKKKK